MKERWALISMLASALLLVLAVGLGQAQGPGPENGLHPEETNGPVGMEDIVTGDIPIQGRLTDANGNSIPDGTYTITFRLYDAAVNGTLLCEDTDHPAIANGLFTTLMGDCTAENINGQDLWLGIQVEGDEEMQPRQQIAPIPYARSLRPGAVIGGDVPGSVLRVDASSTVDGSKGVYGRAYGLAGITYGVYGESYSRYGYGGFFVGTQYGGNGVALKAAGSGIIQSTAKSYL